VAVAPEGTVAPSCANTELTRRITSDSDFIKKKKWKVEKKEKRRRKQQQ
jgi:hypothetical protein